MTGTSLAQGEKATICHVPNANPEGAYELLVTQGAMEAHLKNHPEDFVGTCQARCEAVGSCDDGNACTIDACSADGSCDNSQPVDCDDGDVCTQDDCNPGAGCLNPPVPDADEVSCDDADLCSAGDLCIGGACVGTPTPNCCVSDTECTASDACATRYCEDATNTCQEVDVSDQCTADACEVGFCDPANGCGTTSVTCPDDGDICTVAACNPFICGEGGGCQTSQNPNPPEPNKELSCNDGLDNDCDGRADALDNDCEPAPCPCFTADDVLAYSERPDTCYDDDRIRTWDPDTTGNVMRVRNGNDSRRFFEAWYGWHIHTWESPYVLSDESFCDSEWTGGTKVAPISAEEFEACSVALTSVLDPCGF